MKAPLKSVQLYMTEGLSHYDLSNIYTIYNVRRDKWDRCATHAQLQVHKDIRLVCVFHISGVAGLRNGSVFSHANTTFDAHPKTRTLSHSE